ncbi:MAG: glycoside hydrolase family 43 protein [Fibrobacter sp.]|nr:glycoside hydrolase family 43 protein [Fibrobacter sp.]
MGKKFISKAGAFHGAFHGAFFGALSVVLAANSMAASLSDCANSIKFDGHLNNLYKDLTLPSTGAGISGCENMRFYWTSCDTTFLRNDGTIAGRLVNQNKTVQLSVNVTDGTQFETKKFDVSIHGYEPYTNYLFIYFPANNNENIYYAISNDGYNFTAMNGGNRVVAADSVSLKKGLRDPHILRAPDGYFYMVNTDMKSAEGWASNRGMVLMRSKDLVNWSHSTVHFPDKYKGTNFANVTRVWAPETIWDKDYENSDGSKGRLMIYFSLLTNDGTIPYDKVYYLYANDDFTDVLGKPTYFFDRGSATIDMDIVYNENDSLYHAFFKNEGDGGICKTTAKKLTAPAGKEGSQWSKPTGTLQQTKEAVEGAGVFKLINQDSWILMYDCYMNGHYQFTSSPDLTNFTFVQDTKMAGAFTPRHGTVLPITAEETQRLMKVFPTADFEPKQYNEPDTLAKTSGGEAVVGPCAGSKIIPYSKVNDGGWNPTTDLLVEPGSSITFGPHPWDGKIWKWSGPADLSATTREVTLKDLQWQNSGIYTIEYTNETGCKSYEKIKLVVNDPEHPYVEPVVCKDDEILDESGKCVADPSKTEAIGSGALAADLRFSAVPVRVQYFSMTGVLLKGKPKQAGVYLRRETLSNGLVRITRTRVQ